jgi:hypothetical protein
MITVADNNSRSFVSISGKKDVGYSYGVTRFDLSLMEHVSKPLVPWDMCPFPAIPRHICKLYWIAIVKNSRISLQSIPGTSKLFRSNIATPSFKCRPNVSVKTPKLVYRNCRERRYKIASTHHQAHSLFVHCVCGASSGLRY